MVRQLPKREKKEILRGLQALTRAGKIDKDFVPYLTQINKSPYATTMGCCIGHVAYWGPPSYWFKPEVRPANATESWGYLQVLLSPSLGMYLVEACRPRWDWLWLRGSAICEYGDNGKAEAITSDASGLEFISLGFAWDAQHWPQPAIDLTQAIERFTKDKSLQVADDDECMRIFFDRHEAARIRWLSENPEAAEAEQECSQQCAQGSQCQSSLASGG